jgi:hypothetical protein
MYAKAAALSNDDAERSFGIVQTYVALHSKEDLESVFDMIHSVSCMCRIH